MSNTYIIQVNQITTGPTGHVNITYIGPGIVPVTYGNNLSPGIGVQREDNQSRPVESSTQIFVTKTQFEQSLAFSKAADLLNNSYFGLCNNCVDFGNKALEAAGLGAWSIDNYLRDNTLTDAYAKAAEYICNNEYVDLATSNVLNALTSANSVNDVTNFVDNMSWLADHATGSDFYLDSGNYS